MEELESTPHFIDVSLGEKSCDLNKTHKDHTKMVQSNAEKCEGNEETPPPSSSPIACALSQDIKFDTLNDKPSEINGSVRAKGDILNDLIPALDHPITTENCMPLPKLEISTEPSLSNKEVPETDNSSVSDSTGDQTFSDEKINNQNDGFELTFERNDASAEDISRTSVESDLCQVTPCSSTSLSVPSSEETSPLHNSEVEKCILLELNKVLTSLGFGIKKQKENGVNGIDTPAEEDSPAHESHLTLAEFIQSLQYQLSKFKLASEKFRDDHYTEVQGLERALAYERSRLELQESTATQTITQLKTDLEKKTQLYEAANKDKEGMVVKYAMSEKSVITVRKDLELAERRLREANKARDLLSDRLKTVQSEKEKANNALETKGQEFSIVNRENQRLKEDLKWTQNKLKMESESKKEAEQRITDLIRKLEEARLEAEQSHKDAQNAIKSFQVSEENKAVSLDHQLREQHAKLILERHGRADTEVTLKQMQAEVDSLKAKQQALISENNQLSLKVQTLEKDRLDGDQRLSRLKQESDKHHQEVADLREKLVGMESLRAQLQHNEDQLSTCRNEMERLRQTNVELQQDAAACREREAELLDFTQKLTEKNVRLQSEFSALEAKAQMLEGEQQPLTRRLTEAETKVQSLTKGLEEEQKLRQEENSILARHLAESTHRLEQTQQQLEDSQGEIEVLKRKHAASIRELTREIQQSRKRQEIAENSASSSHHSSNSSTSIAQGSRTSSSSSINTVCEPSPSPILPPIVFPNGQEPDKHVLIERLVKLQKENAKKAEKLDFMEEHAQVLVSELQKKTRLIQNFVMKMPAGALSSESMDQNKADLAKKSGIMASMYGSKTDETMSAELSMEINRKLQAVLEDTLLKNITLKENIDTLGAEIARLSAKTTSKK
ncbi:coiled-coil domain-containing protein 186 isoform X2 [Thrips palmi]|uniref:Coiled-coil domain-containing protein 186 isoform X2 n=1 Tax=Thrips palmi TaxID=161013 RepID=A0A6P8Z5I2_THRPL|nr:coiled-coil domain-containing protein 186 isoform X2 [Thrips palmi]